MARRFLIAVFTTFTLFIGASAAWAQENAWVQIESHSSLAEARARADAYGTLLPRLNGFALPSGWFTLTLGPFDEATAAATLRSLRAQGLIPRDSFVSDGRNYGAGFLTSSLGAVAPLPEVSTAPAAPAIPTVLPDETEREARASERALTGTERRDLQIALQWFGFYNAAIDGAFGPGTRRSMAAWQAAQSLEPTGILTTRQRATLLGQYAEALAVLGLESITDEVAGIRIEAPMGLVQFDRYEAPFAHYTAKDDSGVQMILISQPGDRGAMNGLYEILQTLDIIPAEGPRSKGRDDFSIRGESATLTSETRVRLRDGHIHGFILVWPPEQAGNIGRVLPNMEASLQSVGPAMDPIEGFDASQQSVDLVSGLAVRRPVKSRSGFFLDAGGRVLTTAELATGCTRLTINQLHDATVSFSDSDIAILTPTTRLAPVAVAAFAQRPARLRSPMSVAGFPFEGILGAATLTFGTLEDLKGLTGDTSRLRLALSARPGDAGGPVFDESGAVAGILLPNDSDGRVLPENVAFARTAQDLAGALIAQGIEIGTSDRSTALPPEDLTTLAADMTVLVSCWE